MSATVIKINRSFSRLQCSACGVTRDAACNCGVPYILAGARAAQAVAANPEKSDRAIAEEIGVGKMTVQRARKSTAPLGAVDERRIGRDGKTRKLPKPKRPLKLISSDPIQDECVDCDTPEQHWQRSLSNLAGDAISMRAYWVRQFGKWEKFGVPTSLVTLAKQAAREWSRLAADLSKL